MVSFRLYTVWCLHIQCAQWITQLLPKSCSSALFIIEQLQRTTWWTLRNTLFIWCVFAVQVSIAHYSKGNATTCTKIIRLTYRAKNNKDRGTSVELITCFAAKLSVGAICTFWPSTCSSWFTGLLFPDWILAGHTSKLTEQFDISRPPLKITNNIQCQVCTQFNFIIHDCYRQELK